ncbi:MAG TPA: ABC transporter permease [Bryobacteraceae bacterium]|jgi:predicted permease|nr:ABC transporter permease [Bryobacteraceae bacterium]
MESIFADVRQSLRILRKSPAFTVVAVAALALGIGANAGIFSVVDKVLLQPLPYPEPDRLMRLGRKYPNGEGFSNSIPKYMAWRQNNVFAFMTLYDQEGPGMNLGTGDRPVQVKGVHISADYFKVFGGGAMLGRTFTPSEDSPNGPKAVLLSERIWKANFGADPQILSRTAMLNGDTYSIVGVIPDSFQPEPPADLWIAVQADPNSTNQGHYLAAAGRLKPGVTLEQARSELRLAGERFRRANPKWMDKTESVAVTPMRDSLVRGVKTALWILLGAVGLVLLIACANVANLLLARASVRQKELAIRTAVGASRWRVVQQLLTESVILSSLGGFFGFLLGIWGVKGLLLFVPGDIPRLTSGDGVHSTLSLLDWRVMAFTLGVSFLTGILFGLFPALRISNPDLAGSLKEASGRSATGRRHNRIRKILVGAEMALALVLLASAALLIRTFIGLSNVQSGIDPHHVLTMQTSLVGGRYGTTEKVYEFTSRVLRRLESVPGIEAASTALAIPTNNEIDLPFNIAGKPPKSGDQYNGDEQYRAISPHYFQVFHIPLLRGRTFDDRDLANSTHVVLINQFMTHKYWPKENPVGQIITIGKGLGPQFDDAPRQVIGIVGDVRESGLEDSEVGVMYVPYSQLPQGMTQLANSVIPMSWCIRSPLDAKSVSDAVQRELRAVDSQMTVARVRTMEEVLSSEMARHQFNMLLLSIFAGVALILAAIGIYGLMSYAVEQQTQEFGIRMALGADGSQLLNLILKQGMKPALIGVGFGLAAAIGLTRLLSGLLYGVKPWDPASLAAVAIVLSAVALFATYLPARQAMKLDPMEALREP